MRQQSFAEESFEKFGKKTRKEQFLGEMERIVPRQELTAAIGPFYPHPQGAGGRRADVADLLPPALVQPVGSRRRRSAL